MSNSILDAVSAVFVYRDQLFYIVRQNYLRAFPGYTAFPGGKVDAADLHIQTTIEKFKSLRSDLCAALLREMREELHFDMRTQNALEIIDSVDYLGVAITPDFNPYRFATHFFKITLNQLPSFKVDENEAALYGWKSPKELLDLYQRADLIAVPPIIHLLQTLNKNINCIEINDLDYSYDSRKQVPMIESIYGVKQLMPLSETLPPANRTNCFLIGDQLKFVIDPSPRDFDELKKLYNTIGAIQLAGVFLTHHHSDHHQYAPELAQQFACPIFLSQDTYNRLIKNYGDNYFLDRPIHICKEGDFITDSLSSPVRVYAIPGHDEGHLGLAPDNMKWFIVGDLFQGVGTVVVGGAEGDMSKYFNSLKKVILLKPKAVFPSHGIALGGVNILQKTLEHRIAREEQVLELAQQGLSAQDMLPKIYFDIPTYLHKYALKNIEAHLNKLKKEGRV
jgi:ribonuclease/clavin/mitogillin